VVLSANGRSARVDEFSVVSTERATTVEAHGGAIRVATVEHLFAALAGLGIHRDLAIEIDGAEMPLLDGGASAWCAALEGLCFAPVAPPSRVVRDASFAVGASRYTFSPGDHVRVDVRFELEGHDALASKASWDGDAADFLARIAPARTFALEHEVEALAARGLAKHVDPESVLVLTPDAILHAGRAAAHDEPVRHKLLDLLGDLYVHGGPPLGHVRAARPGHAANAAAMRRAITEGIVATSIRP
jgi:UDP-3-O-[3-hydroxymyristoyl] N-acetylglucosamine deacetylase